MELLETLLHSFVNLAMLLFEYIGVGVITYAGIQGLVNYMRKAPDTRLVLAQSCNGTGIQAWKRDSPYRCGPQLKRDRNRRQHHRAACRPHDPDPLGDQK